MCALRKNEVGIQALASSAAKEGKDVSKDDMADLLGLVEQIVPFHMLNNAEPEAVDLLLEVRNCCCFLDSNEQLLFVWYRGMHLTKKNPWESFVVPKQHLTSLCVNCI